MLFGLVGVRTAFADGTNLPVIVADFNHDGIPDVLIPSSSGPTATVSLGTLPGGSFNGTSRAVTLPSVCTQTAQGSMVTGDFNGDGLSDIAFFCGSSGGIGGVLLSNGDGTFATAKTFGGIYSTSGVVGDFDHDGKLDIVVVGPNSGSSAGQGIQFFHGNGDGTFGGPVFTAFGADSSYSFPVAVDVNNDGYTDIVLGSFTAGAPTLNVFGNNKDGTFGTLAQGVATASVSTAVGTQGESTDGQILVGNLLAANEIDFAVPDTGSTPGFFLVKNTSSGTMFSLGTAAKTAFPALKGAGVGSFTGSGFSDLVAADGTNITVLVNDGTGTFSASYASLAMASVANVFAVADANGDTYSDIYTAVQQTGTIITSVSLVNGSATATSQPVSLTVGTKAISAAWSGDVNFAGSTATGTQTVNGVSAAIALNSNKNPSKAGDAVTFAVLVTAAQGTTMPTGSISLLDGTTTIASGTLSSSGAFSATVSSLAVGTHSIQAVYAGDMYFTGLSSGVLTQVVNQAQQIVPTINWANPNPITYGTPIGSAQLNAAAVDANGVGVAGTFVYTPAAGTVLGIGTQTLSVAFTPSDTTYASATSSVRITVTKATPMLTWPVPSAIPYGTALSGVQLNASAKGIGTGSLPGSFVYSPAAGVVPAPGTQTLSVTFTPTDSVDYTTALGSVTIVVSPLTLTSFAPNVARVGDPNTTVTLTGSGFVTNSVVLVNGAAVATAYVNPTTLTAIIPASDFGKVGTLQVAVSDPGISATTAAQTLTVTPATPAITLTGPATTSPGSQPAVSFALTNPYPVPLTASFNLLFAPAVTPAVDDPAIQFANGGRNFTFTVPANSVTTPAIQLQAGTVAGTITVPLTLTAQGVDVTPANLAPVTIVVPKAIPTVSTTTLTRNGTQLSVAIHGFSNTREVTTATFHFTAAAGAAINTPDVTAPVGPLFTTWFDSTTSVAYGSTFTYTQVFDVSDDAANVGTVEVTLTNSVGVSTSQTAQ
ncbi:EF hand domain/PKD domain protein [Granulicella sibirica]|uniref:EF hand domain/PKD domain protein n=2 Tax=Granulicella sibirica TaxID=2479048 RepID=A0A4V1L5I3_9BACT|nr:EF hand domain/PKD domain protein [Granulicella sibirica]